ncbi:MAG: M48 family metallopeptidase [Bacteroidia bacterium]|nr:M48 family metallopeptidase [Bacteroidia bacterium]
MIHQSGKNFSSNIDYKVIYSRRRTLGISVLPDSSVVVRVPYRTSAITITRLVEEKSAWIIRHRDNFRNKRQNKPERSFKDGSSLLFRGNTYILNISESRKKFVKFNGDSIDIGLERTDDEISVRKLLQKAYKTKATEYIPVLFNGILEKHSNYGFQPTGFDIRSMKRRWGSCSNKGKITLSSELIILSDKYIEYVIVHELCHLRHHNHAPKFYEIL